MKCCLSASGVVVCYQISSVIRNSSCLERMTLYHKTAKEEPGVTVANEGASHDRLLNTKCLRSKCVIFGFAAALIALLCIGLSVAAFVRSSQHNCLQARAPFNQTQIQELQAIAQQLTQQNKLGQRLVAPQKEHLQQLEEEILQLKNKLQAQHEELSELLEDKLQAQRQEHKKPHETLSEELQNKTQELERVQLQIQQLVVVSAELKSEANFSKQELDAHIEKIQVLLQGLTEDLAKLSRESDNRYTDIENSLDNSKAQQLRLVTAVKKVNDITQNKIDRLHSSGECTLRAV